MDLPKQLKNRYLILFVDSAGTTHILNADTAAARYPAMFNDLFEAMETARANRRRWQCSAKLDELLEAGCPAVYNKSLTNHQQNEAEQ